VGEPPPTLRDLLPAGGVLVGDDGARVRGIAYDSRLVEPGFMFAALRGADADGHLFVADALRRGASALLVERAVGGAVPQLVVTDTRAALAWVAAVWAGHPSRGLPTIGITGTDGKTTTAFLVDHLLRRAGLLTGMVGTVAVRLGDEVVAHETRQTTPESTDVQRYLRAMADGGADWAVLEATSHGLAMHRLDHVAFRIGAVTNITHEHLDFHGTIANYRRAKGILVERVAAERGVVVLNGDDEGAMSLLGAAGGAEVVR